MSIQEGRGTKYPSIKPRIDEWEIEIQAPHITTHIKDRWNERTTDACSPREAWVKGVEVTFLRQRPDFYSDERGAPDRLRYYWDGSNEVVLVERNGVVTTVLLVSGLYDPVLRRTLRMLRELVDQ